MRQKPHFVRDHGETTALLTGAGSLDGGVESEQVGLLGDGTDHLQHAADLRALAGQRLDHLDGLVDGARQLIDLAKARLDVLLALAGLVFGGMHLAGGVFGVLRHVLHSVGHLVDGGRHQLHLLRLLLAVALRFAGDVAKRAGGLVERAC